MIGDDLVKAVKYCTSLGLQTRCVSNGFWASSPQRAEDRIAKLRDAGLKELNISTGDEHQEFVPFEVVLNAAFAAASNGIDTIIINEGSNQAQFRHSDMAKHPRVIEFLRDPRMAATLHLLENVWMSFHSDHSVEHGESVYEATPGCTNVLDNFVATPDGQMASCCGLTLEHIPELKIGNGDDEDFSILHRSQLDDFLKVWISVEGPKKILAFAYGKDPRIKAITRVAHMCEACVQVYKNPLVRNVLLRHFEERVADIQTRFYLNRLVQRGVPLNETARVNELVQLHA